MKLRAEITSTVYLTVRCTPKERSLWRNLAKRKGKPISVMVRDGLNTATRQQCLCEPGSPVCQHCTPGEHP